VTDDPHSPTTAAPTPEAGSGAERVTVKAPAVPGAGPRTLAGIDTSERPEILVGAAFAGGFLFAMILKRLGG
jgi:hypothetical protein